MRLYIKTVLALIATLLLVSCLEQDIPWRSIYVEMTDGMFQGDDAFDRVTQDLVFLRESLTDPSVAVSWYSDNTDIIDHDGNVTRPADEIEMVTITIELVGETDNRTYTITVYVMPIETIHVTFISFAEETIVEVPNLSTVDPIEPPHHPAFDFIGWRNAADDSFFDFETPIKEDLTLIAEWEERSYRVTFDSRGGSEVPSIENVIHSETILDLEEPVRAGYLFVGWIFIDAFGNEQLLVENKTIINGNIKAYALWIIDQEYEKESNT
jgi:hypothetical protein